MFLLRILLIFTINKFIIISDSSQLPRCSLPLSCLPLTACKPFAAMLKTSPMLPSTLKFLNSQLCGLHNQNEPKVCCSDEIPSHKSIKKQLNESPCEASFRCVSLPDCGPLMYLLGSEKPLTQRVVKFIKSQQCGSQTEKYPEVCCKLGKGEKVEVGSTTKGVVLTTEKVKSTISLKEKSEVLNKFFNSEGFDFLF